MLKLIPGSVSEPYNGVIEEFLGTEFPVDMSSDTLANVLLGQLYGTKQHRPSPLPGVTHQAAVHAIVERHVQQRRPIPILVPWGSRKPDNSGADIAEISALRQLECLNLRVKRSYDPGVHFVFRVEDVTGWWLFDGESGHREAAARYMDQLRRLVDVLGFCGLMEYRKDSDFMSEETHRAKAEEMLPWMSAYLTQVDLDPTSEGRGVFTELESRGWRGVLPYQQRAFYMQRYIELYPGWTKAQRLDRMARYFSGSWARTMLAGSGMPSEYGAHLQLNFSLDPPGMPSGLASNRLYYRTVLASRCRTHMPPWRARGILYVNGREATPKLRYFTDAIPYTLARYTLQRAGISVELDVPVHIES